MLYLTQPSTPALRALMLAEPGEYGQFVTPREGRAPLEGVQWAGDNNAFTGGYKGDEWYLTWLRKHSGEQRERCLFIPAPDVVGDYAATLERSLPLLGPIRELGYPVALVAQDGMERSTWDPWDEIDALFIGGTDAFKLGPDAAELAAVASSLGKWVHMGRVNSAKRLRYADWIGCDSADGTFVARAPDKNLARMLRWREQGMIL